MKKIFSALCLFAVFSAIAHAAPYNLDAPIESYTWGEGMKTVMDSDSNIDWKASDSRLFLMPAKNEPMLVLRFFHDRLAWISQTHSSSTLTQEKRDALYNRYLEEFIAKWGGPSSVGPCQLNSAFCTEMIWNPTEKTRVALYYNTAGTANLFIGYAYMSREIWPEYVEEASRFGERQSIGNLVMLFREKPEYAQEMLKGKRFRIKARVVTSIPLKLEDRGYEVHAVLRDKQDAKLLEQGRIVTVSGVAEGVKEGSLQLSDTIRAQSIVVDRQGKSAKGFFTAETFSDQLETAANRVEKGFSIRRFFSDVRLEDRRAVMDFYEKKGEDRVSFSIEPLYADQSGDTIVFQADLKESRAGMSGYFFMAMISVMMKATQPDMSMEDAWEKLGDAMQNRKKVVINGWTYQSDFRDEQNVRFSATAPRCRN